MTRSGLQYLGRIAILLIGFLINEVVVFEILLRVLRIRLLVLLIAVH